MIFAVLAAVGAAWGAAPSAPGAADLRLLQSSWEAYRARYVEPDGRVVDPAGGGRSTSEGQAYAMVRALVIDDPDTFERSRAWSQTHLQGGDATALPAWLWGLDREGRGAVRDPMPASDADEWMAWALLGAAERWQVPGYRAQALAFLDHIWNDETRVVGGTRVLLPGPWAATMDPVRLNPSYFLPFAWRVFAEADPAHDWASLIDPAYALLDACRGASGLPPDWCYVDAATGAVVPPPADHASDAAFGFEAFRIAWTLAAEAAWFDDARAHALLAGFTALHGRWASEGALPAVIAPSGAAAASYPYQGLYGAMLPAWGLERRASANALWRRTLRPTRAAHGWGDPADYYGQNWIWLGYALWHGAVGPQGAT